jgi:hypothetical protein
MRSRRRAMHNGTIITLLLAVNVYGSSESVGPNGITRPDLVLPAQESPSGKSKSDVPVNELRRVDQIRTRMQIPTSFRRMSFAVMAHPT